MASSSHSHAAERASESIPRCIKDRDNLEGLRYADDGVLTHTSREQEIVEDNICEMFEMFLEKHDELLPEKKCFSPHLEREKHLAYLKKGLLQLSSAYECLDASRPWLCYWILHSCQLLDVEIPEEICNNAIQFLGKCQCPGGGFAGGPGQNAHLAPTYAAILALASIGTEQAYCVINRQTLQSFLISMRTPEGAFTLHAGGEIDVRGAYCAAVSARLTNVATPAMFEGTAQWIVSCQTYEGGFAGQPGMEAHGGYSFCSVAALMLLEHERLMDMSALLRWLCNRQMRYEGGFQGRTNKLVDGCYSFWQAGAFPLIHKILMSQEDKAIQQEHFMFDQKALQEYLLLCCQHRNGGLIDKPGKGRDFYHTCYCLSGLSIAQMGKDDVIGDPENELKPTHPLYNIELQRANNATKFFEVLPIPQS